MSYPSTEVCKEVLDDIWALIPERGRFDNRLSPRYQPGTVAVRVLGQELGTSPRHGSGHVNHAGRIAFNGLVPRAWDPYISEPYEVVGTTKRNNGEVIEREGLLGNLNKMSRPSSIVWDTRTFWGQFGTYGLDQYAARPDYAWDTTAWKVVQLASEPDQLGIFASSPAMVSRQWGSPRIDAAIDEGHFALDRDEARALLADEGFSGFLATREEQAIMQSYRLTEQGTELLRRVLGATLDYIQEFEAAKL